MAHSDTDACFFKIFVQARMTSERLPGKVLMPFRGKPLIRHVLDRVQSVCPWERVVVLTSNDSTDDPLAAYVERLKVTVFRGSLLDVYARFCRCAEAHPCPWILRVSADSPLLDTDVLLQVLAHRVDESLDLVTTTFPRTFPRGQNAELIRVRTLVNVDRSRLTDHDREHVTAYFYRNADRFRIKNVESDDPRLARISLAVDTMDDFRRLEAMSSAVLSSEQV